jgi:hypothetical protein
MSTYLPGVSDFIPQIQAFSPDFNFYSNALQMKQSQYDSARNELNTIYGSMLNNPLTREDTSEARDNFFKTINQDIKKISGMDLSLTKNKEAASTIFNQMLGNKQIMKDMVWTSNFNSEMRRAEGFKNCTDPDKCGGSWWDGGEQLMMYQREEFRNADPNQMMGVGDATFVPYQDVTKKALALAKEADLNVSMDQISGQWIVKRKNGQLIEGSLQKLFMGSLGQDPNIKQYYQAKATLDRKNFMYSNQGRYGSLANAEQAYINEITPSLEAALYGKSVEIEDDVNVSKQKQKKLTEKAQSETNNNRSRLESIVTDLYAEEDAYRKTADYVKDVEGNIEVARNNRKYSGEQIDNLTAAVYLGNDISEAANIMSMRNAEVSYEANPYAMEATRHANSMRLAEFNHSNNLEQIEFKFKLDQYAKQKELEGSPEENTPVNRGIQEGSVAVGSDDPDSPDVLFRGYNQYQKNASQILSGVGSNMKAITHNAAIAMKDAGDKGDVYAREDYVKLVGMSMQARGNSQDLVRYQARMNAAKTLDARYKIATEYKIKAMELNEAGVSKVYDNLKDFMNPHIGNNGDTRDYLVPVWNKTAQQRMHLDAKNVYAKQLNDEYYKAAQNIANAAEIKDDKYGKKWADGFRSYIGADGKIVSKNAFIQNMVKKGWSKETADSMYFDTDADDIEDGDVEDFSIHEMWKMAYTDFNKPKGVGLYTGVEGGGNSFANGVGFNYVDPKHVASKGTQYTKSVMSDVLNMQDATFSIGGFKGSVPEQSDANARAILSTVYGDFLKAATAKGNGKRPLLNTTYTHHAGGNENVAAINIKISPDYAMQYKGTAKEDGIMNEYQQLANEGITVYFDNSKANNAFTEAARYTDADVIMNYKGEVELDEYSKYTKDFKIKANKQNGTYNATGMYRTGIKNDGSEVWEPFETEVSTAVNLNDLIGKINTFQSGIIRDNSNIDQQYKLSR